MRHSANIILAVIFLTAISESSFGYWTPEVRISGPGTCWQPRITVSGDTLHVIYVNNNGPMRIDYLRSTDRGRTWTPGRMLSDTINTDNAYDPCILIYGRKILVVWRAIFVTGYYDNNLGYAQSTNGGQSWSAPAHILSHNSLNLLPFAMANNDSLVNLIYGELTDTAGNFYNVRSTNFGASWQQPGALFSVWDSEDVDMDADADTFYYLWSGLRYDTSPGTDVYYMKSTDGGDSWSDLVPMTPVDGYISHFPALSTNGQGRLVFSWTDWIRSPYWFTADIYIKLSSDYGETWSQPRQLTFDHLEDFSHIFYEGAAIHAVWQKYPYHQEIIYGNSTDDGATWGDEIRLDHDTSDSFIPRVAGWNNRAYVVWYDTRPNPDTVGWGIYFTKYLPFLPGDANNSGDVNGLDVSYLVNYFKGFGPPPEPFLAGDANGNCTVNGLDVVYLINYFKSGPEPIEGDCP